MICRYAVAGMALACLVEPAFAYDARVELDPLIAKHAAANNVPASLVHRIIIRESRYNPRAVGLGGAMGLMQIKYGTARALGYRGPAAGLLDADTNLTYGVRYLAGAYQVAGGDQNRAVVFYARGYYYDAKRRGMLGALARGGAAAEEAAVVAAAPPQQPVPSLFSLLFSPRPAEPVQEMAPQVAAETEARPPKRGRSAKRRGAARAETVVAEGGPVPAIVKTASEEDAGAPVPPRSSGRRAKRTAASDANRSAQKASAQPDDPGTHP